MLRTLATLAVIGSAFAQISNETSSACPTGKGVHIIVARASTEPEGYGITGAVKDVVLSRIPGSTAEFVVYPATLTDYQNSESAGVVGMKDLVSQYISNCPGQPFVLMGYSQGAQVTIDTIIGQEDQGFTDNSTIDQPLPDSTLTYLAAAVVYGDPTFVTTETFHVGNATQNGDFPRQDVSRFTPAISNKIASYCDAGDLYCAGGNSIIVHVSYIQEYGAASEDFVVNHVNAWYGNNTGVATGTGIKTSTRKASGTATASKAKATASASRSVASASASATPSTSPSATAPVSTGTPLPSSTGAGSALRLDVFGMGAMLALALFVF